MIGPGSKELLLFFETVMDRLYVISESFVVEYMSASMIEEFGHGVGKKCHEVLHHSNEICSWCRAKEVFGGQRIQWEQQIPRLGRTFDLVEFPLKNADGTLSKVTIFRDVTEQLQTQERMRASEEDFKRLFEHAGCGVLRKASPYAGRYLPNEYPDDLAEAWEEMCGLNLDDGWLRMVCLHKLFGLCFFIRERYEDAWLGYSFSKKVKTAKGMKVWPRRAASKANPFQWASIYEVQIVKFEWHEDLEQYKVVLTFQGNLTQTYWFKAEFADVPMGEGWVRPVLTSQFNPL